MERFTDSIKAALANKNWYAALGLALALPDMCGRLDSPDVRSSTRYVEWFDSWLAPTYTRLIGAGSDEHIFLCGADCYALRCSYVHAGEQDISSQKISEALDSFHFIEPLDGMSIHLNQGGRTLQLQVDMFCLEVVEAVNKWLASKPAGFHEDMAGLLTVWPNLMAP